MFTLTYKTTDGNTTTFYNLPGAEVAWYVLYGHPYDRVDSTILIYGSKPARARIVNPRTGQMAVVL